MQNTQAMIQPKPTPEVIFCTAPSRAASVTSAVWSFSAILSPVKAATVRMPENSSATRAPAFASAACWRAEAPALAFVAPAPEKTRMGTTASMTSASFHPS